MLEARVTQQFFGLFAAPHASQGDAVVGQGNLDAVADAQSVHEGRPWQLGLGTEFTGGTDVVHEKHPVVSQPLTDRRQCTTRVAEIMDHVKDGMRRDLPAVGTCQTC